VNVEGAALVESGELLALVAHDLEAVLRNLLVGLGGLDEHSLLCLHASTFLLFSSASVLINRFKLLVDLAHLLRK